mmetsp:Transcript_10031/g.20057  ORF Transcript_10031/g.20057 Transcript_10031/m.20057 type:complete len:157 (+) Transcript_10031:347-817(+)
MDSEMVWRDGSHLHSICNYRFFNYGSCKCIRVTSCVCMSCEVVHSAALEFPKKSDTFHCIYNVSIANPITIMQVRPAVSDVLGLKGSFKEGPWSYRICSIVIMTPLYASLLVVVGTIFGRHTYFRFFAVKMFSRFGIPPELMDETFHQTKKTFRKY